MEKEELIYLGGVIDSIGYLSIKEKIGRNAEKKPYYAEKIGLKHKDPYLADLIFKNYGGYRSVQALVDSKDDGQLHCIELYSLKANKFLLDIYPYLHVKKLHADILLELRDAIASTTTKKISETELNFRLELMNDIRRLNGYRAK